MSQFWDADEQQAAVGEAVKSTSAPAFNATFASHPWDRVTLGGYLLPGICEIEQPQQKRRVHHRQKDGSEGSSPVYSGLVPWVLQIRVRLWTAEQFAEWADILPKIWPPAGKGTKFTPLDIVHPVCTLHRIKSVILDEIAGPAAGKAYGEKVFTLKCTEYVKATESKPKPMAGSAGVRVAKAFTANAPTQSLPQNAAGPPPSQTDAGPQQSRASDNSSGPVS